MSCTNCPLHKQRVHEMSGTTNRSSMIVIVAPYPYAAEDTIGRPFTGEESRLIRAAFSEAKSVLMSMITQRHKTEISQSEIGLTYVVRCRPKSEGGKLFPFSIPSEYAMACRPNFDESIRMMDARVFIYSGKHTAKLLNVKKPRFTIADVDFIVYNGGKESPLYKNMVRAMIEAIKEAVS